jgi:hypothetical protein
VPPLKRAISIEGRRIDNALGAVVNTHSKLRNTAHAPHENEIIHPPGELVHELLRTVNEELRPEPLIGNGDYHLISRFYRR